MQKLIQSLKKNKGIRNFRIYKRDNADISLGIEGKQIGGAYTPIQSSGSISGRLQIEWISGEVSFTNLTGSTLENPNETIRNIRKISFQDKFAKRFLKPYSLQRPLLQASREILDIIKSKQYLLVDELRYLKDLEESLGIKSHEMEIIASHSLVELTNSKGLYLTDEFSSFNIATTWQQKLSFSVTKRKPFKMTPFRKDFLFYSKLFKATEKPLRLVEFKTKRPKVIIAPEFTWDLLAFFVFSNLNGNLVANKMSRFSKEEFYKKKKVFADWFTLSVNPLQEMTPGASNFTQEGVRNKKTTYIRKGRLTTPILDLKHAQKLRMEPTSFISSPHTTSYFDKQLRIGSLERYISRAEEGLYIPSFLGLISQNEKTGDYSLAAPFAIYIKDGKLVGTLKIMIIGNIFKDLQNHVEWVKTAFFPSPGICYTPHVAIE